MKKHIAFMVSCIMLAMCFCFPVFASTEDNNPSVVSNNVNVTYGGHLNYRVNARIDNWIMTDYETKTTDIITNGSTSLTIYDADFLWDAPMHVTTSIINDTDSYLIIPDGAIYNNWTLNYTNYSINTSGNVGSSIYLGYYLEDNEGIVYNVSSTGVVLKRDDIKYSDDIILSPGQNVTLEYTVHFCFKGWVQGGTTLYDPGELNLSITLGGSIGNGNNIEDYSLYEFVNNLDYPSIDTYVAYNSAQIWTSLQTLVSQGIVDQQKYDSILNQLMTIPAFLDYFDNYTTGLNNGWATECSRNTSDYSEYVRMNTQNFRLVGSDYDLFNSVNGTNYGNRDLIGAIDLYVHYRIISKGQYDTIINPINLDIDETVTFTLNGWTEVGSEYTIIDSKGINITQVLPDWNITDYPSTHFISAVPSDSPTDSGNGRVATFDPNYFLLKITYYFAISDTSLDDISNVPVINVTTPTTRYSNHRKADYASHTLIWYLRHWWAEQHQDVNEDISDESGTVSDTQEQIHAQEQQWYSDNEAAIEATGLSNFEFSSGELDGLTQLRLQFSQVWGALGDWTLVYIFVLSLSLATFILRHRPTTKAQQRMTDSEIRAAESRRRSEASHRARLDTNELYAKYYYGDYK